MRKNLGILKALEEIYFNKEIKKGHVISNRFSMLKTQ